MRHLVPILLLAVAVPQAFSQSVISARSGLINFSEGDVLVNGQPLLRRFGTYVSLKEGSDLITRSGRAEMLLTPNTYLRVGERTTVRMVSDSLGDTRLELLGGSAMLDSSTAPGKTPVTISLQGSAVRFVAPGKFRMDSDPPQLRVFEGEAEVETNGHTVKVAPSQLLPLDGASIVRKFNEGSDNLLDLWSDERHMLIASNLADAQSLGDPLLDPDPMMPGDPGYAPLSVYLPLVVPPYPGAVTPGGSGTLIYGAPGYGGYGVPGYGPYGIYSAYFPYGIYGAYGVPVRYPSIYSPSYPGALRPGGLAGFSSGLGGLRPGIGGIGPGSIHTIAPPHPISGSHPVGRGVTGRR